MKKGSHNIRNNKKSPPLKIVCMADVPNRGPICPICGEQVALKDYSYHLEACKGGELEFLIGLSRRLQEKYPDTTCGLIAPINEPELKTADPNMIADRYRAGKELTILGAKLK